MYLGCRCRASTKEAEGGLGFGLLTTYGLTAFTHARAGFLSCVVQSPVSGLRLLQWQQQRSEASDSRSGTKAASGDLTDSDENVAEPVWIALEPLRSQGAEGAKPFERCVVFVNDVYYC